MSEFDILFEKLAELARDEKANPTTATIVGVSTAELDEIEELRRFSSEIQQESEPPSFTTT